MRFRKSWKRFWTLDRHRSDGFTLVELIVVIAILAILAGVGTWGYSAYIKSANKGNDKTLVGNVMRAMETSAYSLMVDFAVAGQYSNGLQIPVGFVVLSDEMLTGPNGQTGYVVAISNDTENDPIGKSMVAAFGADYSTQYKLSYTEWDAGTIGGSTLHNATAGMMDKINTVARLMVGLQDYVPLTDQKYSSAGEMIISVAGRIADYNADGVISEADKTAFIQKWLAESNTKYDQVGFGLGGRENYSAVRMAYNNAFAEYVRANYSGEKDAHDLADDIANYGESAGDLAASKAPSWSKNIVKGIVNGISRSATFAYTANATAFTDPNYPGYDDADVKALYTAWLAGPAATDAAMFYDTMVTAATDGSAYAEENGDNEFVKWFTEQAKEYSKNLNDIQSIVKGKNAIVVVVYYKDSMLDFDVYSSEADPRND